MTPAFRAAGTVLSGRYRLAHKLGEGGMGEVFAADPVAGGHRVAIKVLRGEYFADMQVRSRFVDEAQTCMRLVHPNIVRILECAQAEDGLPYLVMDLLEGVPLGAYMQGGARVPLAQAVPILHGILAGLGAAHASAIVHRDLKPDNVFLTRDPAGRFVVKVLDFGIAKVMDVAGGMGSRTQTGMLLGTPAYMSPEQARNARDVDQRADLWSAGVLFYEMLTGNVAFPAPTEFARLAAILTDDPERIDRVDATLAFLVPFFERALKKNRDERFTSAADMTRELAAALAGTPPRADLLPQAEIARTMASHAAVPSASAPEGTLASPPARPVSDPPPQVIVVSGAKMPSVQPKELGETLESKPPRPIRFTRGMSPGIVIVLVLGALLVGILLGWLGARLGPRASSASHAPGVSSA